jgi:hypothetical protein
MKNVIKIWQMISFSEISCLKVGASYASKYNSLVGGYQCFYFHTLKMKVAGASKTLAIIY